MALIGMFQKNQSGKIAGKIETLSISAEAVFVPSPEKGNGEKGAESPHFRVYSGKAEIGAAWKKTSERTGKDYLSVKLDDPTFPAAIFASLVEQEDGTGYALLWSRR
jgi:uncharacterized protein (DUF736 family)